MLDATRLTVEDQTFEFDTGGRLGPVAIETEELPVLAAVEGDVNQLFAAVGFKFNVRGNALLTVNALVSLRDDEGLQDEDPVWLFAFENSF